MCFLGFQDPDLPAHVVLHGIDQAWRVRRLKQGGSGQGQERGRKLRISNGIDNHRVNSTSFSSLYWIVIN